jgi:hypothetical protein
MKILFVVPGGNDLGGIITSTEQYIAGLKEAGNEVRFMTVGFNRTGTRDRSSRVPKGKFADEFSYGPGTGELMHPTQGWRGEPRLSLMEYGERQEFIAYTKYFDIVIWASMYGFRNPDTEGKMDWMEAIVKLKGKNVFFIHDDHLPERYPWAYALAPYARAMIGVQPCSYDSLEGVAEPRAMIYTPLPPLPRTVPRLEDRKGFFMCQVWKGWKNGHRLVEAAPLLPKGSVTFAGDGIQLRYIRSPDKCPPRFQGIWEAAMAKQKYAGVLQEPARDDYLRRSKFLVDLSLRQNSGQYNRIVQEAMAQGCVVIADPRFITSTSRLFIPAKHYVPINAELTGEALAWELQQLEREYGTHRYPHMQAAARKLLKAFDRKALGERIVKVATTKSFLDDVTTPEMRAMLKHGRDEFQRVFGGRP